VLGTAVVMVSVGLPELGAQVSAGTTALVSLADDGSAASGLGSQDPGVSDDGRYVVFESSAPLAGPDANTRTGADQTDIYRRDRDADGDGVFDEVGLDPTTGEPQTRTELVSVAVVQPPDLTVANATAVEGGTLTFPVTLSSPAPATGVSFLASTANGTATAGDDFTALTNAPFSFAPGQTTVNVPVATLDNGALEANETMTLTLSAVTGANPADTTATGTILDNDLQLFVVDGSSNPAFDATANEGDPPDTTPMGFNIQLTGLAPAGGVSFRVTTSDGTATAGSDYQAVDQVLSIPAGSNAVGFAVTVIGDLAACGDGGSGGSESLNITISEVTTNPPGLASILDGTGVGGIIGDDTCVTLRQPRSEGQTQPGPASTGRPQCLVPCGGGTRTERPDKAPPATPAPSPALGTRFSRAQVPPAPGTPEEADGPSVDPSVSADGRFVGFASTANNLLVDQFASDDLSSLSDVFVRDMALGVTYLVSATTPATATQAISPTMSAGGTDLAFLVLAPVGCEFGCETALTLADMTTPGAPVLTPVTELYDYDFDGEPETALAQPGVPAISADGQFVTVEAVMVPIEGPADDVILVFDQAEATLQRVDAGLDGDAIFGHFGNVAEPTISAGGQFVAFTTDFGGGFTQIVVVDRDADEDGLLGPDPTTDEPFALELLSRDNAGEGGDGFSSNAVISADGRYVAFTSNADDLLDDADGSPFDQLLECGSAGFCDAVMVRDRLSTGPTELASVAQNDPPQNSGAVNTPAISGTGRFVAFDTDATNLVASTEEDFDSDVFVRTFTPSLVGAPSVLDFGTVLLGDDDTLSATFTHVGFGPLNAPVISVTGPAAGDFTVVTDTCVELTLHQGESCVVSIRYAPTAAGVRSATLEVAHDGLGSPATIGLTGGAQPRVAAFDSNPDTLVFPAQLTLTTSTPRTTTITNTGNVPFTINTVTVQGAQAVDFTITADGCSGVTLEPGATCTVSVRFRPSAVGERRASLRVDDTAIGGPHLVGLVGTGSTPTLEANPAVVHSGGVIMLRGDAWPPGEEVTVNIPGMPAPITATIGADGTVELPAVIFHTRSFGPREITAHVTDNPAIALPQPVQLLVQAPGAHVVDIIGRG
jgi:Tol biopolymer transport system component